MWCGTGREAKRLNRQRPRFRPYLAGSRDIAVWVVIECSDAPLGQVVGSLCDVTLRRHRTITGELFRHLVHNLYVHTNIYIIMRSCSAVAGVYEGPAKSYASARYQDTQLRRFMLCIAWHSIGQVQNRKSTSST